MKKTITIVKQEENESENIIISAESFENINSRLNKIMFSGEKIKKFFENN